MARVSGTAMSSYHDAVSKERAVDSWSKTKSRVLEFSHAWTIENFSFYQNEEFIASPPFGASSNEENRWRLELFPKGVNAASEDYISIHLNSLSRDKNGVPAKFSISIVNDQNEAVKTLECPGARRFFAERTHGFGKFVRRDFVLDNEKNCLVGDKLTVFCKVSTLVEVLQVTSWAGPKQSRQTQNIVGLPRMVSLPCRDREAYPDSVTDLIAALNNQISAQQAELKKMVEQLRADALRSGSPTESSQDNQSTGKDDVGSSKPSVTSSEKELPNETDACLQSQSEALVKIYNHLSEVVAEASTINAGLCSSKGDSGVNSAGSADDVYGAPSLSPVSSASPRSDEVPENTTNPRDGFVTFDGLISGRSASKPGPSGSHKTSIKDSTLRRRRRELAQPSESDSDSWDRFISSIIAKSKQRELEDQQASAKRGVPLPTSSDKRQEARNSNHHDGWKFAAAGNKRDTTDAFDAIGLTKYAGDMSTFREWWLNFMTKVHERLDLTYDQKLSYLKSLLEGGARDAIVEVSSAEDSYIETLTNLLVPAQESGFLTSNPESQLAAGGTTTTATVH